MKKINLVERYANKNWYIFPCLPGGKKPITTHGLKDATTNIVQIKEWDKKNPNANWAVRTGKESGIFVVDVDVTIGGMENWGKLVEINGIPETAQVRTPSGGIHFYFRILDYEINNSTGSLPDGIDIRANGGYALLPGVSKDYYLINNFDLIAEPPEWLIQKLIDKKIQLNDKNINYSIPIGARNKTLFSESCSLRYRGWRYEETFSAISAFNENRCEEPLPDEEILTIVKNSMKYEPSRSIIIEENGNSLGLINAWDLYNEELSEPVWAVPNLLPVGLAILAGNAKVGKSWLALQISKEVASGGNFFGENVQLGKVLFLALEDNKQRLQSRLKIQGWNELGLKNVDFYLLREFTEDIGRLQDGGSEILANLIDLKRYRLVIIDTLGKSIYGDQNDYEKMTKALTPIQQMAMECDCSVLMIDHHKKMKGDNLDAILDIQGSAAKSGIADTLIGLYKDKSSTTGKIQILGRDIQEIVYKAAFKSIDGIWVNEGEEGNLVMTDKRQEILDVVRSLEPVQIGDVVEALDSTKGAVHKPLQELVNAGYLIREKKNGNVYYSFSEDMKINMEVEKTVNALFTENVDV